MSPFIVTATSTIFLNMGLQGFGGKVNCLLNFTLLFVVVLLPVLSFCAADIKTDGYASLMQRGQKKGTSDKASNWRKLVRFNKIENRENLWIFIETLSIPSAICFQNKLAFFIVVTPSSSGRHFAFRGVGSFFQIFKCSSDSRVRRSGSFTISLSCTSTPVSSSRRTINQRALLFLGSTAVSSL